MRIFQFEICVFLFYFLIISDSSSVPQIIHQLCILECSDTELDVINNSNILQQPQRLLQKSESSPATRPSRRGRKLCLLVWRSLAVQPPPWSGEGRRGVDTQ